MKRYHYGFYALLAWHVLTLPGCTSMMAGSKRPEVRQLQVTDVPAMAYRKALSTAIAQGVQIVHSDAGQGMFQGTWHGAVGLTVETWPTDTGTTIRATASVLPNKVAFGAFTEADDFIKALQQREYSQLAR